MLRSLGFMFLALRSISPALLHASRLGCCFEALVTLVNLIMNDMNLSEER